VACALAGFKTYQGAVGGVIKGVLISISSNFWFSSESDARIANRFDLGAV